MTNFIWTGPKKGERESDYILRVFNENPSLSLAAIMAAKARVHTNTLGMTMRSALGEALQSIAAVPITPPSPTRAKIKAGQERELQLEAEIAIIKLERNALAERVAMLQRMIRKEE